MPWHLSPTSSTTCFFADQSKISMRDLASRWSMLPILPVPPTARSLPSGEKAIERMPPIECRRCFGSQV